MKEKERQTRTDKLAQRAPTVPVKIYQTCDLLQYICGAHDLQSVAEAVCIEIMNHASIMDELAKHFRRELELNGRVIFGDPARPRFKPPYHNNKSIQKRRLPMRFPREHNDSFEDIARALSCGVDTAVGYLLALGVQQRAVVLPVVIRYAREKLAGATLTQVSQMLKLLNRHYKGEEQIDLNMMYNFFVEEAIRDQRPVDRVISKYLEMM